MAVKREKGNLYYLSMIAFFVSEPSEVISLISSTPDEMLCP